MKFSALDDFAQAYETAALWSSTDDSGEPLDSGEYELAPETRKLFAEDCREFWEANEHLLTEENYTGRASGGVIQQAGHDFWLTRCGHGAGFWDGDWEEPAAGHLTKASKEFGNLDLCVGDDGLIYAA